MCCCCPPAITALFCLWFQSGCSKGTVAGALTFFPPDPPLYQFERRDKDGNTLPDEDESDDEKEEESKEKAKNEKSKKGAKENRINDEGDDDNELGDIEAPDRVEPMVAADAQTHGQTEEQMKSPIEQLTDQAKERRVRSKKRNLRDAKDAANGVTYKLLLDPRLQVPPFDSDSIESVKIPSKRGAHVAAVIYRVPEERVTPQTKTIIVSHGNATDIGAMFPIQVVLSHSLDAHVIVYDYSGYGESGGVPEEGNTYRDIDAVFDYALDEVAVNGDSKSVILYGQSVGSGPCCYLIAKTRDTPLGGLILHSPFTSGMRVLTPSRALACLDIYPNIDRIKKVKCPVMVIHGRLDQEVDISHGMDLYKAVPRQYRRNPWWVPDRGHNDITDGTGKLAEYIRRLRLFMESLDDDDDE